MINSDPRFSADIAQACAKFVMWCMNEGSFEGCDINGGGAQDKAVELGLLDATTYDPNRHGPSDCCEQGDNWYVPRPELISLLSGAPAQSVGIRAVTIEECARVAENYPSSGSATEHPVEYWIRALASQPSPAATVETDDITERAKNCTYGNPDCQRCNPVSRCSADTGEAGDPIRWIKDTYLMWLKGDLDPVHMRLGQHFFRAPPQAAPESGPAETWAHIERLLIEECGLREDEGLQGQRANCINSIKNGLPDAALMAAAVEFLSSGEGLHKIRVNGKMMTRKDVSLALSRPNSRSGPLDTLQACTCTRMIQEAHKPSCPLASQHSRTGD